MTLSPIVLFVYNRPWHVRRTIETLEKNALASKSEIFIYSDSEKSNKDKQAVADVRSYIYSVNGFKKITIIERQENWGLANSIIDGVTTIVNQYGKIIILEDDLLTSPYFLQYMNDALKLYEGDDRVISIHGYNYPVKEPLPEVFFIKGADCWGWATWKRGWEIFEIDGSKLLDELVEKKLLDRFDLFGAYNYSGMLRDQISGKNQSWAIRWYASALLKDKLTLYPSNSFVKNIGNDNSGIHCGKTNNFDSKLVKHYKKLSKIEVNESLLARQVIEEYLFSIKPSFIEKIVSKLRKFTQ